MTPYQQHGQHAHTRTHTHTHTHLKSALLTVHVCMTIQTISITSETPLSSRCLTKDAKKKNHLHVALYICTLDQLHV